MLRLVLLAMLLALGCSNGNGESEIPADAADGNDIRAVMDVAEVLPGDIVVELAEETAESPEIVSELPRIECPAAVPGGPLQVAIESGTVQGHEAGEVAEFLGIPYAAPPVGELRWRPPEPAACLDGTFMAAEFGSECPQLDIQSNEPVGQEDCLTLNVWTPDTTGSRPVLFFIHGGGNVQGGANAAMQWGNVPIYNGEHLAREHDVVVVTINYRLGVLGYLALPELSAESEHGVSGNYGILDQLFALEWVQRNIAGFGGDPGQVMIFGESAGAVNTCTLLASPLAAGLFHGALMESGVCSHSPLATAEAGYDEWVADQTECGPGPNRLACLRGHTPFELLEQLPPIVGAANLKFGFHPGAFGVVVDGWILPVAAADVVEAGEHNAVPVVLGTNEDEYHSMLTLAVPSKAAYENIVSSLLGALGQEVVDAVLAEYPAEAYDTPREALVDLLSDSVFTCPARQWARRLTAHQEAGVYRYFFTRNAVTKQGRAPASHAMELLYVFGTIDDIPFFTPAAADSALAAAMMGYWARFGSTGDPNGAGAVAWPAYDIATDPYLRFDAEVEALEGLHSDRCDFWDDLQGQ
jgi:para-nitrobenzyl esterase